MNHLIRGIALGAAGLGAASYAGIRAFIAAGEKKRREAPGNADQYKPEKQEKHPDSPLNGKTIIFLGSSVTYGAASGAESFVELFEAVDGVKAVKEAVSGTTLADQISVPAMLFFGSGDSYVKRMKKLDRNMKADCLVCQLSTNDATMKKPLGVISEGDDLSSFDAKTVTGAMETIIRYAKDTWNCPVIFYTGAYYESEEYAAMVKRLYELQEKWNIGIIDMDTDEAFNTIDKETYDLYMYDPIHPTKAGYTKWWFPKMEKDLTVFLSK